MNLAWASPFNAQRRNSGGPSKHDMRGRDAGKVGQTLRGGRRGVSNERKFLSDMGICSQFKKIDFPNALNKT